MGIFSLRCLSFVSVEGSGRWLDLCVCGVGRSGLEIEGHHLMEFKASQVDEISRECNLVEKQPEDEALWLFSVIKSVKQEVPKGG